MERYAQFGAWVMNTLGVYYAWVNLSTNMGGGDPHKFVQAVYWAIALCICRYISTRYFFSNLGERLITSRKGKSQKVSKFSTCAFKTMCFALLVCFEWTVLSEQDFTPRLLFGAGNTANLWTGNKPPESLVAMYMASLGYHLHSTIYHVFFVERRSDYHQMVLHHVITLWLMILSFMEGHVRGGSMIVLINDVPDIFVYSSKMLGDTVYVKTSIVSYVLLTITYFYFRLIVTPVSVVHSMMTEAYNMTRFEVWVYAGFLGALYFLHLYWFILILKIGVNIFKSGSRKDILADITSSDD